ncbi:MAG: tir chaperone family protein [Burkholderia sp.]|nr:tir chaperone family protein [Burkholderia sp.]
MNQTTFPSLMHELLRHWSLPLPTTHNEDVYTLYFDNPLTLHIVSTKDGQVNVMGEVGRLNNLQDAVTLLDLLELNNFGAACYPVGVTVHRATGTILVWARQRLMSLDVPALKQLLQCVKQQADTVHRRLDIAGTRAAAATADTLSRMLRSHH